MPLNSQQNRFLASVLSPQPSAVLIAELTQTKKNLDAILGFKIYQNNYLGSLIKTLANIYPVTERLLGKSYFKKLAKRYIAHHPSHSNNLNDYGSEFSRFIFELQMNPDNELADLSYLPEVANFEFAIHRILLGSDNPVFDFHQFAQISPEKQGDIILRLSENRQCLSSFFPLDKIWEMNQRDEALTSESLDLSLTPIEPYFFMLWRKDFELSVLRLNPIQHKLIQGMEQSLTLKQFYELNSGHDTEIHLALPEFIRLGCIVGFELSSQSYRIASSSSSTC